MPSNPPSILNSLYRIDECTRSMHSDYENAGDRYHEKKKYLEDLFPVDSETSWFEQISIGETTYARGVGGWLTTVEEREASIPSERLTWEQLNMQTGIKVLPEESIDGVICYHFRGTVDIEQYIEKVWVLQEKYYIARGYVYIPTENASEEKFVEALSQSKKVWTNYFRARTITEELWNGKDDYIIRQLKTQIARTDGTLDRSAAYDVERYYDFDIPITIEQPLDAEGNLLPGWSIVTGEYYPGLK